MSSTPSSPPNSSPPPSDNSTTTPTPDSSPPPNSSPPSSPSGNSTTTPTPPPNPLAQPPSPDSPPPPPTPTSSTPLSPNSSPSDNSTTTATPPPNPLAQPPSPDPSPPPPPPTPISSTPLSPSSSPSDNSTITPSPASDPSAPPPIPDSSPPLRSPNSSTPPPTPDSAPPPPPPDSPVPVTPPPSNKEPPPPPSNVNKPPSPPPPTPNAPSPVDISPPPPIAPISHPRQSPSPPPPSGPGAPPPTHTSSPPPLPVPPGKSSPAPTLPPPPADLPAHPPDNTTFSPPLVPGSSSPPPQNNTPVQAKPSTPIGNPTADSTPPSPNNTTTSTTREAGGFPTGGAIAIVLVGVLALSLVVFAAWFVHRRKKKRTRSNHGYMVPSPFASSQNSDSIFIPAQNAAIGSVHESSYHSANLNGSSSTTKVAYAGEPGGMGNSRSWFTYEELVGATNDFSEDNLLGEGGFGYVYKGNLADGREVAVKQLKIGSGQGEREFRAEVEIISRIHHRHLVSIVGYCISASRRLLVYDYVPNNTLHYHLHGNVSVMSWATRFKVAAGAARGIAYLHEDCTPRIIHRDIKSANILLDNNFEAKVADFGLAKLVELEARTHVSTRVMGTFGYMAPEYATTGKLTEKSDVFSFGVVLLELITGRKPVDSSQPLGDESLVEWARPLLAESLKTESFENLVDPRLENNYVKIEMLRLIEAAAACVRHSAPKRPKMSQVARAVDGIGESSDLTNGMKPGDSQIIDSREQSAQIRMFQRMAFGNQEHGTDSFSNSQNSWSGS